MSRGVTIDTLIDEIKSLSDEYNDAQLSSDFDILPSLNRAQEKAWQLLSRIYPEPIMDYSEITVAAGTREVDLPEDIWEDKVKRIEWVKSNFSPSRCEVVSLEQLAKYERDINTPAPRTCVVYQRKLRLVAPSDGAFNLRLWYCSEPAPLVRTYGRITATDETTSTIYLGEVSDDFSIIDTSIPNVEYVNVIDGQTGKIKGSFQVRSWDQVDTLQLKTIPDRTLVFNRTIDTTMVGLGIQADDYVCYVKGTCVPLFLNAVHTFMIQYSIAEIKRKLGYAYDVDQKLVADFEVDLRKTTQGRARNIKIKRSNAHWVTSNSRRSRG